MTSSGAAMQNGGTNQEIEHSLLQPGCLTPDILTLSAKINVKEIQVQVSHFIGKKPYMCFFQGGHIFLGFAFLLTVHI